MSWFIEAVKKYAVFGGRSRRKEFWYFTLFYTLIAIVFTIMRRRHRHPQLFRGHWPVNRYLRLGASSTEHRGNCQEAP